MVKSTSKTEYNLASSFFKWLLQKSSTITRILFSLRTGHNRLRAQLARHRTQQNPSCQECDAPKTTKHALLHCTALEMERLDIIHYFSKKNISLNLPNLLGLNLDLCHSTQKEIKYLLVRFLKNSRLVNRS